MRVQIANIECDYEGLGTIVDCYPRLCFLCPHYQPTWFKDKEVTPKELRDLISKYKYIIRAIPIEDKKYREVLQQQQLI